MNQQNCLKTIVLKENQLYDYPVKILLAFELAVGGNKEFFDWLFSNGYPELAALSNAIRGNTKAIDWLIKNGFPHFAAFDAASVDDEGAMKWLQKEGEDFLITLARASRGIQEAIDELNRKDLVIFVRIAMRIKQFADGQTFDYHRPSF